MELASGLGSARSIFDIAKGFFALKTEAEKNAAILSIQREALETQQAYSGALKRVEDLEQEIMRLKDWSAEKQDYVLADTGQGSLAYEYLEGVESGHPAHWICPQCYEEGKKSILKHETLPVGRARTLACHRCGFDVVTHGVRHNQNPPKAKPASWGRGR